MRISIDTSSLHKRFGIEKAFQTVHTAGFDCVDVSFFRMVGADFEKMVGEECVSYAHCLREQLDNCGLVCNQAHAPFDELIYSDTFDLKNTHFLQMVRSMQSAAILGAETIVVHMVNPSPAIYPLAPDYTAYVIDYAYDFYKTLEPFCCEYGIRVGVENLWNLPFDEGRRAFMTAHMGTPEIVKTLLQRLHSEWFVACVDTGHAVIAGNRPEDFIAGLDGKILRALHVQESFLDMRDMHTLPYIGDINWNAVCESLVKIGYTGDITLEIPKYVNRFEDELLPAALRFAADIARHLVKKVGSIQAQTV